MIAATQKSMLYLMIGGKPSSVKSISPSDLKEVLKKGIDDFKANPSHIVMLFFIYPIVMLLAGMITGGYDIIPLVFPLLAGFALVGPIAAIGAYEMSRRREKGLEVSLKHALEAARSPSIVAIVVLSIVLGVIYLAWLGTALAIYQGIFGNPPPTVAGEFARQVFTTSSGWTLIVVGTVVGAIFATVVLTIAAISFPMLLDQDVGLLTAVRTSVKAVMANPVTMTVWGLIVVAALILGALPVFIGLSVVMPVLGHSTWHLYRKVSGGMSG